MAEKTDSTPPNSSPPWQPRFGIGGLLLVMTVVCVMSSGGYYLMQGLQGGRQSKLAFILFTLAAPMLVAMFVSIVRVLFKPRPPRRKQKH